MNDQLLTDPRLPAVLFLYGAQMIDVEEIRRASGLSSSPVNIRVSLRKREIYPLTKPRADLCAFDAYGMDLIEGRI